MNGEEKLSVAICDGSNISIDWTTWGLQQKYNLSLAVNFEHFSVNLINYHLFVDALT